MVYRIMYITKMKYIALCGGHSQKASYLSQFCSDWEVVYSIRISMKFQFSQYIIYRSMQIMKWKFVTFSANLLNVDQYGNNNIANCLPNGSQISTADRQIQLSLIQNPYQVKFLTCSTGFPMVQTHVIHRLIRICVMLVLCSTVQSS